MTGTRTLENSEGSLKESSEKNFEAREKRSSSLVDPYGRRMRKLRVSLLDACNFRCLYCMPLQARFMPKSSWLSVNELVRITQELVRLGIQEIRLTGGEPTLRPELVAIARALSPQGPLGDLGLQSLSLTSNGFRLEPVLPGLLEAGCRTLNISIDSLDRKRFAEIARFDGLPAVVAALESASTLGFSLKLNVVVMRGLNDDEILDFLEFGKRLGAEVRFLELMAIGPAAHRQPELFVSASEIRQRIEVLGPLRPVAVALDSTARVYHSAGGHRFGIIAPVTESFCGSCSRWRLTAEGFLKTCLMSEDGVSLREQSPERIAELCSHALGLKPRVGGVRTERNMNTIGG